MFYGYPVRLLRAKQMTRQLDNKNIFQLVKIRKNALCVYAIAKRSSVRYVDRTKDPIYVSEAVCCEHFPPRIRLNSGISNCASANS